METPSPQRLSGWVIPGIQLVHYHRFKASPPIQSTHLVFQRAVSASRQRRSGGALSLLHMAASTPTHSRAAAARNGRANQPAWHASGFLYITCRHDIQHLYLGIPFSSQQNKRRRSRLQLVFTDTSHASTHWTYPKRLQRERSEEVFRRLQIITCRK